MNGDTSPPTPSPLSRDRSSTATPGGTPREKRRGGSVAHYSWWQKWLLYPVARTLAWLLFLILGPITVRGRYRIPSRGPVLILANHLADVDPIVVQLGCKRPIQFMAKSELFSIPVLGRLLRWFRVFPVKRGEPDRAAMRHAIETLKLGEAVGVFPEGQLSETGELQEVKPGIALIIKQAASDTSPPTPSPLSRDPSSPESPDEDPREKRRGGSLPVICCGVRNTNKVMPYGRLVPRISFSRVNVEWGEVREFTRDSSAEEIVEWATQQLRELTQSD